MSHQRVNAPLTDEQQELVTDHLGLVHSIARGWRVRCRTTIEHAELVQVGSLGLVDAARRWDKTRGLPFAAMAADRIRGAICDHFRALDPLTRERRRSVRSYESAASDLRAKLGREPKREEVASALGWTAEKAESAGGDTAALAAGWAQVRSSEIAEDTNPVVDESSDPFRTVLEREQRELLLELLGMLPERERMVLDLYYREELQLKEIGDVLGVTESRACQLHGAAIKRIKSRLAERTAAMVAA